MRPLRLRAQQGHLLVAPLLGGIPTAGAPEHLAQFVHRHVAAPVRREGRPRHLTVLFVRFRAAHRYRPFRRMGPPGGHRLVVRPLRLVERLSGRFAPLLRFGPARLCLRERTGRRLCPLGGGRGFSGQFLRLGNQPCTVHSRQSLPPLAVVLVCRGRVVPPAERGEAQQGDEGDSEQQGPHDQRTGDGHVEAWRHHGARRGHGNCSPDPVDQPGRSETPIRVDGPRAGPEASLLLTWAPDREAVAAGFMG